MKKQDSKKHDSDLSFFWNSSSNSSKVVLFQRFVMNVLTEEVVAEGLLRAPDLKFYLAIYLGFETSDLS